MGHGIEHREPATVLQSYEAMERPNFAIYAGTSQKMYYDGGDMQEGKSRLEDILSAIDESQNQTVYTLKVFEDGEKRITKKTPEAGSTTFMFSNNARVKTENGVMVLDRTSNAPANQAANNALQQRFSDMEKQLNEMREKLHAQQLAELKKDFANQIAGLAKQQEEKPDVWERLGQMILEKPERLDKIIDKSADVIGYLFKSLTGGNKNFIQERTATAGNNVRGTSTKAPEPVKQQPMEVKEPTATTTQQPAAAAQTEQDSIEVPVTDEGALVNPFLTDEQKKLKKSAQYDIVKTELESKADEELDNLQMVCIEILEQRIKKVTVTHLLLAVACLDNEDLNKVLNNLA